MNCEAIKEQMSEALDGPLDATRQAAFDAHLARCPACAEDYAALQEAVGLIHELEPLAPPADLIVGINAAIDRESGLHVCWNLFNTPPMRVALAASVVVVVGILGMQYLDPAPKESAATIAPKAAESISGSRGGSLSSVRDEPRMEGERPREPQREVVGSALKEDDRMIMTEADEPPMEGPRPCEPPAVASEQVQMEDSGPMVADVEERTDRKVGAKGDAGGEERFRPLVAAPMPEPVVAPPSKSMSAPASTFAAKRASRADEAAMDVVDHDEGVWNQPAPAGIVHGLSVGKDDGRDRPGADELQAGLPTDSRANERRIRYQADTAQRQEKADASPLLRVSVAGLSRETVVQLANEAALRKHRAAFKEEAKLAFADQLAADTAPAPVLSVVSGEREVAAQDPTETIIFHLPRAQLAAFLEQLGILDRNMKVLTPASSGDADESVEIQIQLNP